MIIYSVEWKKKKRQNKSQILIVAGILNIVPKQPESDEYFKSRTLRNSPKLVFCSQGKGEESQKHSAFFTEYILKRPTDAGLFGVWYKYSTCVRILSNSLTHSYLHTHMQTYITCIKSFSLKERFT